MYYFVTKLKALIFRFNASLTFPVDEDKEFHYPAKTLCLEKFPVDNSDRFGARVSRYLCNKKIVVYEINAWRTSAAFAHKVNDRQLDVCYNFPSRRYSKRINRCEVSTWKCKRLSTMTSGIWQLSSSTRAKLCSIDSI